MKIPLQELRPVIRMNDEYLSIGFRNVDRTENQTAYVTCLNFLNSLPYFKEYKLRTYELLQLERGMTVLEAGCGLGDDAFRIAEQIMPGGKVVAFDASAVMIAKARSNERSINLPVEFQTGDIRKLPFPDHSFSRCRVDRVLQHIPQPETAVFELVRVLEPYGILLAYDNDWGTFSIASESHDITCLLTRFWANSFTNSQIGRDLRELFIDSDLSDIKIYPSTCILTDFEKADKVYNLRETVRRAAADNIISQDQGYRWIEELITRTREGCFKTSLTACTVVGRKYP